MINSINKRHQGSVYLVIIGTISVIFIVISAYMWLSRQEINLVNQQMNSSVAYYLAESGLEKGVWYLKNLMEQPLVSEDGAVNNELLDVMDLSRASIYSKTLNDTELIDDGRININIEFRNINPTSFGVFILDKDTPERLSIYQFDETAPDSRRLIGGWQGNVLITSTGYYRGRVRTIQVLKEIKVADITPIAPEHTLFIWGKDTDYLKEGEFLLSHGMGSLVDISQTILDEVKILQVSLMSGRLTEMIYIVRDFIMKSKYTKPQDKGLNEVFQAYRLAGRVRTNGTLHVYLPFFEVDDIINYFVSIYFYERPEVGYPFCKNSLHERFMSWATKYEGDIKKHYFELLPYVIENQNSTPKVSQYTKWSTFPDYSANHPSEKEPENLSRLRQNARRECSYLLPDNVYLSGTQTNPLVVNGLWFVDGDLRISGYYQGRALIVSSGDIYLQGNLISSGNNDLLSISSLNGRIILPQDANIKVDAAICSANSILQGNSLEINGNLTVEKLNRYNNDLTKIIMPDKVKVNYNSRLRGRFIDNVTVAISWFDTKRSEISQVIEE